MPLSQHCHHPESAWSGGCSAALPRSEMLGHLRQYPLCSLRVRQPKSWDFCLLSATIPEVIVGFSGRLRLAARLLVRKPGGGRETSGGFGLSSDATLTLLEIRGKSFV